MRKLRKRSEHNKRTYSWYTFRMAVYGSLGATCGLVHRHRSSQCVPVGSSVSPSLPLLWRVAIPANFLHFVGLDGAPWEQTSWVALGRGQGEASQH
jgi:hypothetical protein